MPIHDLQFKVWQANMCICILGNCKSLTMCTFKFLKVLMVFHLARHPILSHLMLTFNAQHSHFFSPGNSFSAMFHSLIYMAKTERGFCNVFLHVPECSCKCCRCDQTERMCSALMWDVLHWCLWRWEPNRVENAGATLSINTFSH